jgi:hypothetical protein
MTLWLPPHTRGLYAANFVTRSGVGLVWYDSQLGRMQWQAPGGRNDKLFPLWLWWYVGT